MNMTLQIYDCLTGHLRKIKLMSWSLLSKIKESIYVCDISEQILKRYVKC